SADAQLAGFPDRHLAGAGLDVDDLHVGVGERQPDRARLPAREMRRGMSCGRRFRQTVAFVERPTGALLELFDHFNGTRRAAGVEQPDLVETELLEARMAEQR